MYMHTVDSNNNNKKYRNQSFYMDLIYAILKDNTELQMKNFIHNIRVDGKFNKGS